MVISWAMAFYWTAKGNFYAKLWTSPAPPVNGTTDSRGSVTTVCLECRADFTDPDDVCKEWEMRK